MLKEKEINKIKINKNDDLPRSFHSINPHVIATWTDIVGHTQTNVMRSWKLKRKRKRKKNRKRKTFLQMKKKNSSDY